MIQIDRSLSRIEKEKRSSVLEYINTTRIIKSRSGLFQEKAISLKIGLIPLDKIIPNVLDFIRWIDGLIHYKLIICINVSNKNIKAFKFS